MGISVVIDVGHLIVDIRKVSLRKLVAASNRRRLASSLSGSRASTAVFTGHGARCKGRRVRAATCVVHWDVEDLYWWRPNVVRITMPPLLELGNTDLRCEARKSSTIASKADVPRAVRRRLKLSESVSGVDLAKNTPATSALPLKTNKKTNNNESKNVIFQPPLNKILASGPSVRVRVGDGLSRFRGVISGQSTSVRRSSARVTGPYVRFSIWGL